MDKLADFSIPHMNLFSVETVAFSIFGYSLSWLELVGTIFNLWSVWLVARNRILSWPVGLIGGALFLMLFWQIQLYADCFEQIYFIVTGVWGWWVWHRSGSPDKGVIRRNTSLQNALVIASIAVLSVAAGWATSNLHLWAPEIFPVAASFAYLDATTTIMSFAAQILMAYRRLECWLIWITVDVIGIWLYWQKGVFFVAGLYVVFLVLAVGGLIAWARQMEPESAPGDAEGVLSPA